MSLRTISFPAIGLAPLRSSFPFSLVRRTLVSAAPKRLIPKAGLSRATLTPLSPLTSLNGFGFTSATPYRGMARLTNRRRTAVEEERESTTTTGVTTQQETYDQKEERERSEREFDENISQEGSMTPATRRFLTKVYGTIMATMGFAAGGAVLGVMAPAVALPAMIASFFGVLGVAFLGREKVTLRQNLMLGTGALMGAGIGPLLAMTAPGVVFAAALGTMALFGGFTVAALRAKRASFLAMGGPLIGGLFVIFAAGMAGLLLPMLGVTSPAILGALYNVNLYGGLLLFSLFISYDTQAMIERYHQGDDDHISPALNMFLNIFNIFIRLIQIFRGSD